MIQRLLYTVFLTLSVSIVYCQIENIQALQQDSIIIINYDLVTDNPDGFSTQIYVANASGDFTGPLESVTGDVGTSVNAGRNKKIIWNVLKNLDSLVGDYQFKIVANPLSKYSVNQCNIEMAIEDVRSTDDKLLVKISLLNHGEEFQSYFGGKIKLKSPKGPEADYVAKDSFLAGKEGSNTITLKSENEYIGTLAFSKSDIRSGLEYRLNMYLPNPCEEKYFILPLEIK